jgi:hypothetical protein
LNGSLADTEHYWNRRRRSFRGERRRSAGRRDNDAHVPMDEISR